MTVYNNSFPRRISKSFKRVTNLVPLWAGVCLALGIGIGVGAVVMKFRKEAKEVIVVINGDKITLKDYRHRMEIAHGRETLLHLLEDRLTIQYAREHQMLPAADEINKKANQIAAQPNYRETIIRRHLSEADVTDLVRTALVKEIIVQNGVSVTDAEVNAVYRRETDPKNMAARLYQPETASLQVIVTATEKEITPAWQAIKQNADFGQTAQKYSAHHGSTAQQGKFGVLVRGRNQFRSVPGFESFMFGLKSGDTAPPKEFGHTWWIVRCLERTHQKTIPFKDARQICQSLALAEKSQKLRGAQVGSDFSEYRKHTNIQVFWERYAPDINGLPESRVASGK